MLHGMAKRKDFIVDVREKTARGIWKRPKQKEKVDRTCPVDWTWPGEKQEQSRERNLKEEQDKEKAHLSKGVDFEM